MSTHDPTVRVASVRRLRWSARAPRLAVGGAVALLALAGLRGLIAPPKPTVPAARAPAPQDIALEGFAVEFVRAYLTFDPPTPRATSARSRRSSPTGTWAPTRAPPCRQATTPGPSA